MKRNIEKALFVIANLFFASIIPSAYICSTATLSIFSEETRFDLLLKSTEGLAEDTAIAAVFGAVVLIFLLFALFLQFFKNFLFPVIYLVFKKSYFHEVLDKFVDKPLKFLLGAILTDFVVNSPILIMLSINNQITFIDIFIMFCVLMAFTGGVFPCWLTFLIWRKIVLLIKGKKT